MGTHVWRFSERECEFYLSDSLFIKLSCLAKKDSPNETGGTLIGHYTDDKTLAIVENILVVSSFWPKFLQRFTRPSDTMDKQLSKIYKETNGKIYYLGDWHSHPQGSPQPSSTDLNSLKKDALSKNVATDTPILFIIGRNLDSAFPDSTCTMADNKDKMYNGEYSINIT